MEKTLHKIAFGGSCYWCMEAIYQSLIGVKSVEQGFIAPENNPDTFSEAVVVHFNPEEIWLKVLIEIHLRTHSSTVKHSKRDLYRSAIYTFSEEQKHLAEYLLKEIQTGFSEKIITEVLPFFAFKFSDKTFHNYYYSNPQKPFCKSYIDPKLKILLNEFSDLVHKEKIKHLDKN